MKSPRDADLFRLNAGTIDTELTLQARDQLTRHLFMFPADSTFLARDQLTPHF